MRSRDSYVANWLDWSDGLLRDYSPSEHWHHAPASDKQWAALRRRGYEPPAHMTKGEAALVLDRPSPKQRALLQERGLWTPTMTFSEARDALDALARSEGWKLRSRHR